MRPPTGSGPCRPSGSLTLVGGPHLFLRQAGATGSGLASGVFLPGSRSVVSQPLELCSSDGRRFTAHRISWRSGKSTPRRLNLLLTN